MNHDLRTALGKGIYSLPNPSHHHFLYVQAQPQPCFEAVTLESGRLGLPNPLAYLRDALRSLSSTDYLPALTTPASSLNICSTCWLLPSLVPPPREKAGGTDRQHHSAPAPCLAVLTPGLCSQRKAVNRTTALQSGHCLSSDCNLNHPAQNQTPDPDTLPVF